MKKGMFITLEGPDGSGKSTQIEAIKAFFEKKAKKFLSPENREELPSVKRFVQLFWIGKTKRWNR